jgi:hypothetical protein
VRLAARFDVELTPQAVDDDVAGRAMLRQAAAGIEGEQQQPEVPPMDQASLPMPVLGRVGLGLEGAGQIGEVERHDGPA